MQLRLVDTGITARAANVILSLLPNVLFHIVYQNHFRYKVVSFCRYNFDYVVFMTRIKFASIYCVSRWKTKLKDANDGVGRRINSRVFRILPYLMAPEYLHYRVS